MLIHELIESGNMDALTAQRPSLVELEQIDEKTGHTSVTCAIACKAWDILERLLSWGANPDNPNGKGALPITLAVRSDDFDSVRQLTRFSADLSYAIVFVQSPKMIDLLIQHGADVKAGTTAGDVIHAALGRARCAELVATFKKYGADIDARDHSGYTPLMYALADFGMGDAIIALIEAGAELNFPERYEQDWFNGLLDCLYHHNRSDLSDKVTAAIPPQMAGLEERNERC